jgi:predicted NUDIX family phosphoesterase
VLVAPAALLHEIGTFHGFCPDVGRYLPRLLGSGQLRFLARAEAETDPSWKQLIPYVVLRCGPEVFHYRRGGSGSEARLRARRSLGIGGHICDADGEATPEAYWAGMRREVAEEVEVRSSLTERCVGLINDDRTPVGQVHLGVVHLFDLARPDVAAREDALADAGFVRLEALRGREADFETWSQFLLEGAGLEALRR